MTQADAPKAVVVIGGGPAGCEAALTAAQRGHKVVLFEATSTLGGLANIAALPPGKGVFATLGTYFSAMLPRAGVDVRLNTKADADAVRALKPGEAAAVQYSSYALMMLVRLDPLDADTLDSLRAQALSDMKSGELQDSIQSYGAQLPHALDSAAMKKMPASKIKNEQWREKKRRKRARHPAPRRCRAGQRRRQR